jgi:hypothetical protein
MISMETLEEIQRAFVTQSRIAAMLKCPENRIVEHLQLKLDRIAFLEAENEELEQKNTERILAPVTTTEFSIEYKGD